jgi:hypothetical protein
MKYALQIYGVFRTFKQCLPQILNYICFSEFDYDVFILSEMSDGYSIENENIIKELLGNKLIQLKYMNIHYNDRLGIEKKYCEKYNNSVKSAKRRIQNDLVTNNFVTKLWYRRYLTNNMRKEYAIKMSIKYDWVVRTRFDIGYVSTSTNLFTLLNNPVPTNSILMIPDIISIGSESAIDYESTLITVFPYIYNYYKKNCKLLISSKEVIKKWLFMSEMNLIHYIKNSDFKLEYLPIDLKIIR